MTKNEAAIISAYTGAIIGKFSDMHEYIEKIMNRPILPYELFDINIREDIKEKSRDDFIAISNSVINSELTLNEAVTNLSTLRASDDKLDAHARADNILCSVLISAGYGSVVEAYETINKQYY